MMDHVSGFAPSIAITFGRMTSYTIARMMAGHSEHSIFWMNTAENALAIRVKRKLNSTEVIDALTDLFILRGVPAYIRSDNGPEFIAEAVRDWIKAVGSQDSLHRAWLALGKRILRELQRADVRRAVKR